MGPRIMPIMPPIIPIIPEGCGGEGTTERGITIQSGKPGGVGEPGAIIPPAAGAAGDAVPVEPSRSGEDMGALEGTGWARASGASTRVNPTSKTLRLMARMAARCSCLVETLHSGGLPRSRKEPRSNAKVRPHQLVRCSLLCVIESGIETSIGGLQVTDAIKVARQNTLPLIKASDNR